MTFAGMSFHQAEDHFVYRVKLYGVPFTKFISFRIIHLFSRISPMVCGLVEKASDVAQGARRC